jgi:hypothetical protein
MNFDNEILTKGLNHNIIKTGLHFILTMDEYDSRPVYFSGKFNEWLTQDKEFMMEKIGLGIYHYKFAHDFDYPETLLYKFTKGNWSEVEIDSAGNCTEKQVNNKTHR